MNHPIVLLHGWGLNAARYQPLISLLRKNHYTVYAPNFPGFDANHIPQHPLTLHDYVDFLHKYITSHRIKNPIIIGHSFGGRVALMYQHYHPVSGLILTGTPGFTPIPRKKLLLFITIAKIGGLFMSIPILRSAKDKVRIWYYYLVGARDFYRAEGVMRETFKNVVREPLTSYMESTRVPTLLVWGELDVLVPVKIAHTMKAHMASASLHVVPLAGHELPFREPKQFFSAIYDFLFTITKH